MGLIQTIRTRLQWPIRAAAAAEQRQPAVETIVLPQARDRWMFGTARTYTPDSIETTIRGAFAGDLQAVFQLYDLMESTWPRLQKNLAEMKESVACAEWVVQPWADKGAEPTPEAQRRSRLLERALWNMRPDHTADENDLRGTIKDILDAWGKGISLLETHWKVDPALKAFVPRATTWIHPRYYGYPMDGARLMLNGRELAYGYDGGTLARAVTGASWLDIPPDQFLVCVAKQKSGHPIGSSLLRPLAWWWCASNFSASWFLNFAQIFGLPIRWANYDPAEPGLIDQISDMLENMGSSGWAAFPAGTTLELKEPARTGTDNPQSAMLDRADRQCDLLILGQTLTSDVQDSGSRALGDVHQGILTGRKRAAADFVSTVLSQQLARAFCRLNFGDESECPYLCPEIEESEDPKAMADRDKVLIDAGLELPKTWLYERHGIPIPENGEDVVMRQASPAAPSLFGDPTMAVHARSSATDRLVDNVLEDLTGVQAKWLGGVKPWFARLVEAAQNDRVSDAEFLAVLRRAQREIPELFGKLDHNALAGALERAMGAAAVNGAVEGSMKRRVK